MHTQKYRFFSKVNSMTKPPSDSTAESSEIENDENFQKKTVLPGLKTIVSSVGFTYKFIDGSLEDSDRYSRESNLISYIFYIVIVLSFITSFLSTEPSFQYFPLTCPDPACNNDPELCPGTIMCAPQPIPILGELNDACIYVFTIEYGLRFLTCWAVSSKVADIIPEDWPEDMPMPVYSIWEHYLRFMISFKNAVDLATVLPFYFVKSGRVVSFLRVFRLLRFVKVLRRFKNAMLMFELIFATLRQSLPALLVMLGVLLLAMVFYGSIIFLVEGGTYIVNSDFPQGAFVRRASNGHSFEISPFKSVPTSFYWLVTTITTVGYGDLAPTSWIGRMIACCVMMTGMIALALPIGVIGTNFSDKYKDAIIKKWAEATSAMHIEDLDEEGMVDLFQRIDRDSGGTIDVEEMHAAFQEKGITLSYDFLNTMFSAVDIDKDGEITLEEFVFMCKKLQNRKNVGGKIGSYDENDDEPQYFFDPPFPSLPEHYTFPERAGSSLALHSMALYPPRSSNVDIIPPPLGIGNNDVFSKSFDFFTGLGNAALFPIIGESTSKRPSQPLNADPDRYGPGAPQTDLKLLDDKLPSFRVQDSVMSSDQKRSSVSSISSSSNAGITPGTPTRPAPAREGSSSSSVSSSSSTSPAASGGMNRKASSVVSLNSVAGPVSGRVNSGVGAGVTAAAAPSSGDSPRRKEQLIVSEVSSGDEDAAARIRRVRQTFGANRSQSRDQVVKRKVRQLKQKLAKMHADFNRELQEVWAELDGLT